MNGLNHNLTVIDGETLMDKRLPPTKFCVETLLPQGICILGGSPKVGKSWLVLDLCIHIARGEDFWNLPVTQGETLYLCLEDSERRIQERLNLITDDVPSGLYFATGTTSIENGVIDFLRSFVKAHPRISLIAIDTFQMIRNPNSEVSYGGDYAELQPLKALAEELKITLLLVHHLRKMGDKDPINKLSGSTGIAGAVDAVFVFEKDERVQNSATLYASGRDIRDRKIRVNMNENTCAWELVTDSLSTPESVMPDEMVALLEYMKQLGEYVGGNTELASVLMEQTGKEVSPKGLKQMMNKWRFSLEAQGLYFENKRSNGQKFVKIKYVSSAVQESASSDPSDENITVANICVPFDPCVPVKR